MVHHNLIPHGVPASTAPSSGRRGMFATSKQLLLITVTAIPSFLLGTTVALYARIEANGGVGVGVGVGCGGIFTMDGVTSRGACDDSDETALASRVADAVAEQKAAWMAECRGGDGAGDAPAGVAVTGDASGILLDGNKVGNYVTGVALTPKANFTDLLDLGVPLDSPTKRGSTHAMILYMKGPQRGRIAQIDDAATALEPCDTVNVLLTDHSGGRKQCLAIVPNYESFHLQHWMRVDERGRSSEDAPLRLVGRGLKGGNGRNEFTPTSQGNAKKAAEMLRQYFNSLDDVLSELNAILGKIAIDNTVIVMVCNFGQSELLMNFLCQAKARGFDISNLIVFATDQETYDMVKGMGVAAYYDKRNFGDLPLEAAHRYGDRYFVSMMLAKVVCVQLVSMLGYSFLFQDVDLVWYKNPLEYFANLQDDFDVYFQDDGGHSLRYAPYRYVTRSMDDDATERFFLRFGLSSLLTHHLHATPRDPPTSFFSASANTGLYFARHNARSQRFFTSILLNADMIIQTMSHQQALIAVMNEHVSLHGLRVKVFARDTTDEFPGGYHWNQKSKDYMKRYFAGQVHPFLFHMSWTLNKANKILYFEQFGEWWVQQQCIENKDVGKMGDVPESCCLTEPKFECHYRDKPSKFPCKDSPPIDKGRPSFW